MHTLRTTLLLAAAAFAATVFATSTAHAQETAVSFKTEAGAPCAPCVVHIAGEASIFAGPNEISRCRDEFTVKFFTNSGEFEWLGSADRGPGCNAVNCSMPENHWQITSVGENAANRAHMTVRFCFGTVHCNGEITISEPAQHRYALSMNQSCPPPVPIRIAGSWTIEGNPIEIDHTP